MDNLHKQIEEIMEYFSLEDIEFNRKMVNKAYCLSGKKLNSPSPKRNFDFTSEVLSKYRTKWGISEN